MSCQHIRNTVSERRVLKNPFLKTHSAASPTLHNVCASIIRGAQCLKSALVLIQKMRLISLTTGNYLAMKSPRPIKQAVITVKHALKWVRRDKLQHCSQVLE